MQKLAKTTCIYIIKGGRDSILPLTIKLSLSLPTLSLTNYIHVHIIIIINRDSSMQKEAKLIIKGGREGGREGGRDHVPVHQHLR